MPRWQDLRSSDRRSFPGPNSWRAAYGESGGTSCLILKLGSSLVGTGRVLAMEVTDYTPATLMLERYQADRELDFM